MLAARHDDDDDLTVILNHAFLVRTSYNSLPFPKMIVMWQCPSEPAYILKFLLSDLRPLLFIICPNLISGINNKHFFTQF